MLYLHNKITSKILNIPAHHRSFYSSIFDILPPNLRLHSSSRWHVQTSAQVYQLKHQICMTTHLKKILCAIDLQGVLKLTTLINQALTFICFFIFKPVRRDWLPLIFEREKYGLPPKRKKKEKSLQYDFWPH